MSRMRYTYTLNLQLDFISTHVLFQYDKRENPFFNNLISKMLSAVKMMLTTQEC